MAILLIVSTLVMTSCVSEKIVTKVVHEVPDAEFPTFPDPDPSLVWVDPALGKIVMTIEYYEAITRYKAEVKGIQKYWERLRELNEKENKE